MQDFLKKGNSVFITYYNHHKIPDKSYDYQKKLTAHSSPIISFNPLLCTN